MKGSSRQVTVLGLLIAAMALAFAGSAQAKLIRKPLGPFGSAEQQSFASPRGLAVDQGTQELYVLSGGSDTQSVKVSAAAGTFRLKFKGETTADIAFSAPSGQGEGKPGSVQAALEALPAIGAGNVFAGNGPGDAQGSNPYVIQFKGTLANTDLEQLSCENGTTPLSGGSGCTVITEQDGEPIQVTRWNADGTPSVFSALGSNAIDGHGPGEDQTPDNGLELSSRRIAVDESGTATDGDIYVTESARNLVDVFASSGKYLGQLTEFKEGPSASGPLKPLGSPCDVAVDGAGDVYVSDTTFSGGHGALSIHKYHPMTNQAINTDSVANFAISESNSSDCALAAGSGPTAGYLFSSVSEDAGGFGREVFKLDPSTGEKKFPFLVKEEGKEQALRGVKALTRDPVSGRVLASTQGGSLYEYDASGTTAPLPLLNISLGGETSNSLSLAADGVSGNAYVARGFEGPNFVDVYGPPLIIPDVTTETATEVAGTGATLNGTINAASGPGSSCHFQYTTEAAFLADKAISGHDGFVGAQSAPCEPAGPFTGSTTNAVSAKVSGLSPETKYEFRIVGENENGTNIGERIGASEAPCPKFAKTCPEIFETLGKPAIKGGLASEVTTTTAKISGEINPRELSTEYAVQYVTQADFEASGYAGATTTPGKSAGSGVGFVEISQQLSGLQPLTIYHFRLIASNESGTATPGEDGAFTTFVEAGGLPDGRAYEQVSPPVKLGDVFPPQGLAGFRSCTACVPGWGKERMPMQSSPDGNTIAYEGNPFAAGLTSGPNQYVASRGAVGWATTPLSGPQYGDGLGQGFRAFSADLSRGVVYQVEPALSPDAPPGYANLYLWRSDAALQPLVTTEPPSRSPGNPEGAPNGFRLTYAGANAGTDSTPAFTHLVFQANDALTEALEGIAPPAPTVGAGETDLYEWSDGQLHLVNVLPGNNAAAPDATIGSGTLSDVGGYDFDHAISDDGSRIFWSQKPSGQVYVREGGTSTTKVPDPGKFLTAATDGSKVLLSNGHVFDLEDESTDDLTEGQGGFEGILGTSKDLSRVYFVDTKALTPEAEENANGKHAEEGEFNLYLGENGATAFIGILDGADNDITAFNRHGTWRSSSGDRSAQVSVDGRYLAFESYASLTGYDNRLRNTQKDLAVVEVFEYDADTGDLTCASCNPTGQRPLRNSRLSLIETSLGVLDNLPQPHNLPSEGHGRLFFESGDTLSVADANGRAQDVYEWQPEGVGSCKLPRGCVELISSGHGPKNSYFVDATPTSGKDVFFTTWDQLVPFDKDDLMDLYDARVGGGFEYSAQEPCLGEACKGESSVAPETQSPGTAGFNEAVSTPKPACKKGSVKKRGRCVQKKKKHHRKRAAKHGRGGAK